MTINAKNIIKTAEKFENCPSYVVEKLVVISK